MIYIEISPVDRRCFQHEQEAYGMKYTKEEWLDIGHRIYNGEFTIYTAFERFGVSVGCARDYMRGN